jgi:hypothetical protein
VVGCCASSLQGISLTKGGNTPAIIKKIKNKIKNLSKLIGQFDIFQVVLDLFTRVVGIRIIYKSFLLCENFCILIILVIFVQVN